MSILQITHYENLAELLLEKKAGSVVYYRLWNTKIS